ncbi:MAG: MFS transporter [Clostridiales Family XIII bacterium]|jgi:DHA3 family macrolide efflux protein-like MFS transporter|nr:MFS transporter [Clostridiales Family XIII bacterium]
METKTAINWKKNTALFLGGQAVTLIGSSLVGYAVMWYVTLETKSGVVMTVFTIAVLLPTFFISPFGGVWADRYNRKNLINISDGVIALVSLFIALCFSFGIASLTLLLVCSLARSLGQGVQMPAVNALLPQLVPAKHLVRVNSLNSIIQSVSMIGSPALSGVLLSLAPIQVILFIDVVTAAIGISILYFFVRVPDKQPQCDDLEVGTGSAPAEAFSLEANEAAGTSPITELPAALPAADSEAQTESAEASAESAGRSYWHEIRESIRYIRRNLFALHLLIYQGLTALLITPCALLTPLQVTRDFGPDVWRLTAIEIAFSVGMIAGGGVLSLWGGFRNKIKTVGFGLILCNLLIISLGIMTNFALYVAVMAFIGIACPISSTPLISILQEKVDPEYMGRVFSFYTMMSSIAMPAGMVLFGPLADTISIDIILIITGIAGVAEVAIIAFDKTVIQAGK